MSTAVAAVRAYPDKYEKDFDAVVAFLSQYIDRKAPTLIVKVASVTHTRPAKRQKTSTNHGTFTGKIELKKYLQEDYDSKSVVQHQQLYELWKRAMLIKGKKTQESNRALEARVAMVEAKSENSSNESLFADIHNPKLSNRSSPALDREGNGTRQSHADA